MLRESKRLKERIAFLKSQINSLPRGDFFCSKNGKYYKWYHTDGKHQTLIPKKNRKYAQKLAYRKFLSLQLNELQLEQKALNTYLIQCQSIPRKSEQLFLKNEEYKNLLSDLYKPLNQELLEWAEAPYEKSAKYPEQLLHKTISGDYVRSKSEAIISMFLSSNKIPFRYECALQLGGATIYPDFTIRHPQTGDIYYWEHLGLMDDPNYCKNAFSKLQLYVSYGIIPTNQLIITYETKEFPLDSEMVARTIENYFL